MPDVGMRLHCLRILVAIGAPAAAAACSSSSASTPGTGMDASTHDARADVFGGDDGGSDAAVADASEAGVDAGPPATITITSPLPDSGIGVATVKATTNASGQVVVPIGFKTTHFTLATPGMCGTAAQNSSDDHCGYVEVSFLGESCNVDGGTYNNLASASPAEAILSQCMSVDGSHDVVLALHHGDGTPILDPSTGLTIEVDLTFAATGP